MSRVLTALCFTAFWTVVLIWACGAVWQWYDRNYRLGRAVGGRELVTDEMRAKYQAMHDLERRFLQLKDFQGDFPDDPDIQAVYRDTKSQLRSAREEWRSLTDARGIPPTVWGECPVCLEPVFSVESSDVDVFGRHWHLWCKFEEAEQEANG